MKFERADIVRYKDSSDVLGLYEVTGYNLLGHVIITCDECDSEIIEDDEFLILVCKNTDRKDL